MLALYSRYLGAKEALKHLLTQEEEGQTLIEYALLIVLIALALLAANPNITSSLSTIFSKVGSGLQKT